ncbi:hypothetical protein OSTOST_05272, partial [Ostertagia ostertagi]
MSKYLYKQYVRLVTKWPKDEFKSPERDLAVFLGREVERHFKTESASLDMAISASLPIRVPTQYISNSEDVTLGNTRLKSLEQISSNTTAKLYPHQYKSGVFGLNLQQLQVYSRDELILVLISQLGHSN